MHPEPLAVGIDLAWRARARTGLAAVRLDGSLLASAVAVSDAEIDAWLADLPGPPLVVGVDAPLVVPNAMGARRAEREIGRAYGRYAASAYPSNRANPLFDPPRAEELARRQGWSVDPGDAPSPGRPVCLEVYPHAGLIGLFRLGRRLRYKRGPDRAAGFAALVGLLESVPELRLTEHTRWREVRALALAPGRGDLTRIEDEIDAVVCAHLAWLWLARPGVLRVYGSVRDGYIVAPPPPDWPATPDTPPSP